ncbi:MAG: ribonuclease HII [Deltaproteobacteria bacterium]|jgi:ribonuclease HII|nr:ribonuclease HII [Deltaproteobacteria bacterium]
MSVSGKRRPKAADQKPVLAGSLLDNLKADLAPAPEIGFFSPLYRFDQSLRVRPLAGLDEAGRGPLAGPLVAAAVILPESFDHQAINDSKKLTPESRLEAFQLVTSKAVSWAYSVKTSAEVDSLNPLRASLSAMGEAIDQLEPRPKLGLVDGNQLFESSVPLKYVVGGDAKSLSIAAASIVAKVIRDRIMDELHLVYPQYGFDRHKGYGTREHLKALELYGPTPVHRMTYKGVRPVQTPKSNLPRLF